MRKLVLLLAGVMLIAGAAVCPAQPAYLSAFYPTYWITGTVNDAPDGTSANGRNAYFYHTIPEYSNGFYTYDMVGTSGVSGKVGRIMINGYGLGIAVLSLGGTYYVGIPNDNPADPPNGYGADPVGVVISGFGVDELPTALQLTKGGGAMLPPPPPPGVPREPTPNIRVWFGNRLYQPAIYGRKEEGKKPFVVAEKGKIKLEVNISDPFLLNESSSYAMHVLTPQGVTKTFDFITIQGVASATGVKPLVIESNYPEELKATEDETVYTFTFYAASKGTLALATTVSTQCAVTVMGGPLRLIGTPLTFPSPVHLRTDREAYFQYTLSRDGNIDIYVFDISARVVKKFVCIAGQEGGSAGTNKLKWDLITDQGSIVSSGILVFSLVDRDSGKLLGKGKFTALP